MLLFDAAHHHAEVLGLEDDGDALGVDGVGDGVGDLAGEALLHLQAAGEDVDEAGNFAEADDLAVGDVGDVGLAEEGQQMVLAQGEELDVLDDDHLVVVDVEEGVVEDFFDGLVVAAREEGHGFFHALGGVEEAVAGGVFADAAEELAVEVGGGGGFRVGSVSVSMVAFLSVRKDTPGAKAPILWSGLRSPRLKPWGT